MPSSLWPGSRRAVQFKSKILGDWRNQQLGTCEDSTSSERPWRGVRTQRPTHLPLAVVEFRYKAFKALVEENQTLFLSFQTHDCDT